MGKEIESPDPAEIRKYLESYGWVWAGPDGRRSKYRHEKLTRNESGVIREVNLLKAIRIQKENEIGTDD